ncbi:hypothetical protein ScPMuIL_017168 [Solemya velum]
MDRLQLTLLSALFGCLLFRLSSTQGPSRGVCLTGNIDLVFILDASSSVTERNFRLASRFIEMTLRNAEIDDGTVRVGLIVYSSNTHIHFSLGQHSSRNAMIRDLRKAKTIPGSSNTADALLALRTKVFGTNEDRADARNIAILITADSSSGISDAATTQEATQSKQDGVEIYAIGVGLTDPSLLDAIASEPLSSYSHIIDGYRNLEDLRPVLFKTKCVDAAPDIASEIVTQLPDAFQNGCGSNPMDLVFLVDTSLGSRYQRQIRQFLQDLVEYADIESGNVRISFATFNSIPQIIFRLNELNNKYEIKRAIRDAPSNSGNRNTADALDLVRQQILHTSYGNRPGVPDVLLVITTGRSRQSIERAADTLKAQNVNVFAIGLDLHDHTEIERISSEPIDEHTFVLPTVSDLDDMKDLVFAQICTQGGTIRETSSSIADSEELDLVYLLHFSNEMSHDDFNRIISFIKGTVENTDVDSGGLRVGAALYRKSANVLFHLNQYATKEDLLRGISGITFGYRSSSASAAEGLDVVRKRILNQSGGDRPATPNGVIVLTDSNSDDTRETARAARELHEAGVDVLSIGVGVRDPRELSAMASKQEYAFALNDASELAGLRDTIKHSVRALQDKTPAGRIEPITDEIPAKSLENSEEADIFFVFHASARVKAKSYKRHLLGYFVKLLENAEIDTGKVRVSLIAYKDTAQIVFDLSKYKTKSAIVKAIKKASKKLRSNSARLSSALKAIRDILDSPEEKEREKVPKAVVIVTDKESPPNDNGTEEALLLKNAGAKIFAVGVGNADEEELRSVVSGPADEYFGKVPSFIGLATRPEIKGIVVRKITACKYMKEPRLRRLPSETTTVTTSTTETITTVTPPPFTRRPPKGPGMCHRPACTSHIISDNLHGLKTRLARYVAFVCLLSLAHLKSTRPFSNPALENFSISPSVFCSSQADIVVALHISQQASLHDFQLVLQYLQDVLSQSGVDSGRARVGLLVYGRDSQIIFRLDQFTSVQDIQRAILGLSPSLRSHEVDASKALSLARQMFEDGYEHSRQGVPKALIFVTDAESNFDSESILSQRDLARGEGIHTFGIGVGRQTTEELQLLSWTFDNMVTVPDYSGLRRSTNDIRRKIYALRSSRDDRRPIEFPGLFTPSPETQVCSSKADVVFVIDSSTSVGEQNFRKVLDFSVEVLKLADIDLGNVRVAFITYSTSAQIHFHLGELQTKSEITAAIRNIPYVRGETNTQLALHMMWSEVFQMNKRRDAEKIAFVVTDGVSNINERRTIQEATLAKSHGINIFVVGIELEQVIELEGIASQPLKDHLYTAENFGRLIHIQEDLSRLFCATGICVEVKMKVMISECSRNADIIFMLDSSTSVGVTNFQKMLNFTKDILSYTNLDSGNVSVGLLTFSTHVHTHVHLDELHTKSDIFSAIDSTPYIHGDTNIQGALHTMREMFTRAKPGIAKIGFLVTDGVSNINSAITVLEADKAKDDDIIIYVIGIGVQETREMEGIASLPLDKHLFKSKDFANLVSVKGDLLRTFCSECVSTSVDLVLVLDTSTSVGNTNFQKMLNFTKNLVASSDIDSGRVRVGVVTFSDAAKIQFNLGEYHTRERTIEAIGRIPYTPGNTNTADGLHIMRRRMFNTDRDRESASNIAVIVTDGLSNLNTQQTIPQAVTARQNHIHIYAIGIGISNTWELDGIVTSPTRQNRFHVPDFNGLLQLDQKLFKFICPDCDSVFLDIIFVLDSSSSVGKHNFRKMLAFTREFLSNADIDGGSVRVGVVIYSTDVYVQFHLREHHTKASLLLALDSIRYRIGSTNTAGALQTMRTEMFKSLNGDRANVPNVALVLTDGVSNINNLRTVPEAQEARDDGIHIFTVGIGLTDTDELIAMATPPATHNSFSLKSFDELQEVKASVFSAICLGRPNGCGSQDIVFVLDSSTSVNEVNFGKMLQFTKDFIGGTNINSGKVRVGLLLYSTKVHVQFHLHDYSEKAALFSAINSVKYKYGSTNTAEALRRLRTEMFLEENGDRPGAQNIAIVVTDGVSNIRASRTMPEAKLAKASGIHIYTVGIGLADLRELDGIATPPVDKNRFSVRDFDGLPAIQEKLSSSICPVVQTKLSPPRGTAAPIVLHSKVCETGRRDIVFLLDSSTSISIVNFKKMLSFTRDFVLHFDIDSGDIRVGVVMFSTTSQIHFHLDDYYSTANIYKAIGDIDYSPGNTNTAAGLRAIREVMFTEEYGDRIDVPNVAVILTDGVSNIDSSQTISEALKAKNVGIEVFVIGIDLTDTSELDSIASLPLEDHKFTASSFDDLKQIDKDLLSEICLENTKIRVDVVTTSIKKNLCCSMAFLIVGCGAAKIDLVFVLDSSTSVSELNFVKMKNFAKELVDFADIDSGNVRVGIVIYSTEVHVQFQLEEHSTKLEIFAAIDSIPYRYGSTNTARALHTMWFEMFTLDNGDRPDVPNVAIVITDGVSNINAHMLVEEAKAARQVAHVYAIGIGLSHTRELDEIASRPVDDNRFSVQDFDELSTLKDLVFSAICPGCALSLVDLVFVLDTSTSVSEYNFQKMITFMKNLLDKADIDNGNVRVGALTYSTQFHIQFYLSNYTSKADLFAAIDRIPYIYGSTNTADGLLTMRTDMFEASRGNRDGVPNVAILITDGLSNINAQRTVPEAIRAREGEHNIHIYVIGIGLSDTREIDQIATPPASENSFTVQTFDELQGLDEKIFSSVCPETVEVVPPVIPLPPPTSRCGLAEVDLVIILDSSTSVGQENFQKMLLFCKELLMNADIDSGNVRVGIVLYSSEVNVQFQLSRYSSRAAMFDRIDNIEYIPGNTNTAGGIRTMRQEMFTRANGDRPNVRNVAIVMTDGVSNINSHSTLTEAETARLDGIHIYAIGIGLTDTRELNGIASLPASQNSFSVQSFDDLHGVDEKIFQGICPVELRPRTPRPTPPPIEPTHVITLPPRPSGCDQAQVDLVIVLDSSTSVGRDNFQKMLRFCKNLLENADIDSGNVRVGLLIYSTEVHVQFYLEDYTSKADVFNAIDNIDYVYGSTNTADGILRMSTELFSSQYGDRPNVPNIGIVITDGVSNINAHRTISEAQNAKAERIHIFAIGIGLTDTTELDAIASYPASENSFNVEGFDALHEVEHRVFHAICPEPPVTECGLAQVDLVIILDSSTSVGEQNFKKMLVFTEELLENADIDSGSVRVGIVTYNTGVKVEFFLNAFSTQAEVVDAIHDIDYTYGSTNTADGLRTMRSEMFTELNGDRVDVPNKCIIITDGVSNINAQRTILEANLAKQDNIHIYSIGIGLTDTREVHAIATDPPSENSFNVQTFEELSGLPEKIFSSVCPGFIRFVQRPESVRVQMGRTARLVCTAEGRPKPDITWEKDSSRNFPAVRDGRLRISVDGSFEITDVRPEDEGTYRCIAKNTVDNIFAEASLSIPEYIRFVRTPEAVRVNRGETARLTCVAEGHPRPDITWEKDSSRNFPALREGRLTVSNDGSFIIRNVQPDDQGIYRCIAKNTADTIFTEAPISIMENIRFVRTPEAVRVNRGETARLTCVAEGHPRPDITWEKDSSRNFPALRDGRLTVSNDGSFIIRNVQPDDQGIYRCIAKNTADTIFAEAPINIIEYIRFRTTPRDVRVTEGESARLTCIAEGHPKPDVTWEKDSRRNFPAVRDGRLTVSDDGSFIIRDVKPEDQGNYKCIAKNTADTISSEAALNVITRPRLHGYDVVLILDSSVPPLVFDWILDFARGFIQTLSIDDGEFRVGLLVYSTNSHPEFHLNEYKTKAEVLNGIDLIPYRAGQTNTAQAFQTVHRQMFKPNHGDRDFARNYIVLVTGNEESMNTLKTQTAVDQVKRDGTAVFVVGLDIRNTQEVDDIASKPKRSYQFLVRGRDDLMEVPKTLTPRIRRLPPPQIPDPRTTPRPTRPTRRPITTPTPRVTRRPIPEPECTSTGDVVFILDTSGSVGDEYFHSVLNFTYSTVDGLDIDSGHYRVGVITFSGASRNEFFLNSYSTKADIEQAIQGIDYVYGFTHTAAALRSARLEQFTSRGGDRRDVPNVVVIITDGQSNIMHYQTIPEAMRLKRMGVTIITIAVGFTDQTSELVGLTSPPVADNLIYVDNYEALEKLTEQLVAPLCTDTNLCSERNPCQNGGSCIDGLRSYMCLCPNQFFGEHCEKRCGEAADVVFVLDSSSGVGTENFGRMKTYAEHLIREMNMEACNIHVGVMKYSSAPMIQFGLGAYQDTETITRAVDSIHYTRGMANMGSALRTLRTQMFNGAGGDRRGVRNIAYLLTDGSNQVHPEATLSEAELAIGAGIRIMPIGVSLREREEVESIALSQGVSTIEIADEPQLLMMSDQVLSPLFDREDRCAINPCEHGGSCVNEVFRYRCICVSGYSGDNCGKRCTSRGDVVFAVDTSRYMTRKELRRVRRFIRSIVKRMQFHSTSFKVGLVDFSRNSIVHLDFSAGTTKRAVLAAMSTLRSRAGDPLPAEAMRKARIRIFGGRGGEQDRPDYLILITKSMRGQKDIFQEANKLKTGGAKIIGVGIGMTNSDKDYMTAAVSSPLRSSLYLANDVTELKKISDQIMEHMCDDHDVCAENPCQNGGTCVSNHGTFYCQCPKHYAGARCERGCDAVADVVFLIDSSGSVGHHDFRKVKDFVHNMVEHLSIGKDNTRVSVATFSTRSSIAFYLSDFYTKDAVQNAVSGVSYEYGNTNLAGGLKLVRHRILSRVHGDRAEVQNFLVVVTDGLSNINPENTIPEANLLKKHGTHIYSIGVGAFDPWELQAIASKPSSANSFVIKDYNALDSISEDLIRATCRDISICDGSPCANGGTCVPGINMFTCQCQKGFKGKLCERECTAKKDVVFLVDSSGSVGVANFQSSLKFLSNLVEEMTVEGVSNEFGFVTFNSDVRLVFSLGRYKDVETVINAIETSRYSPGATNTAGALRTAIELYGPHYGDRSDAENIVILITDGLSNVKEYDTIPAARELRRMAQIIVVGVGVTNTTEIEILLQVQMIFIR